MRLGIAIGIGAQNAGNAGPPAPVTETVATTGGAGEIIFDPIAGLDRWTAAAGGDGEIVFTTVDGTGTLEAFYRLKSAGGAFTRVTGASPITVTGLSSGTEYEFLTGDDAVADVTSGGAALLLDNYSGAYAAWSLRKLSSSVTNVVRVRRSSDDTEQDFTATEVTDGTLTTFTGANDGFVVTLYDQSGNGRDETNAVATEQPLIVDAGSLVIVNSKPVVRFDGVDNNLLVASAPSVADTTNGMSMFLMSNNTVADGFLLAQYDSGANKRVFASDSAVPGTLDGQYSFAVQVPASFDVDRIALVSVGTGVNLLSAFWAGETTVSRAGVNGGALVSASEATPAITSVNQDLELGAIGSGGTFREGDFFEAILYSTDKTSDRSAIDQDIADFYGLVI